MVELEADAELQALRDQVAVGDLTDRIHDILVSLMDQFQEIADIVVNKNKEIKILRERLVLKDEELQRLRQTISEIPNSTSVGAGVAESAFVKEPAGVAESVLFKEPAAAAETTIIHRTRLMTGALKPRGPARLHSPAPTGGLGRGHDGHGALKPCGPARPQSLAPTGGRGRGHDGQGRGQRGPTVGTRNVTKRAGAAKRQS